MSLTHTKTRKTEYMKVSEDEVVQIEIRELHPGDCHSPAVWKMNRTDIQEVLDLVRDPVHARVHRHYLTHPPGRRRFADKDSSPPVAEPTTTQLETRTGQSLRISYHFKPKYVKEICITSSSKGRSGVKVFPQKMLVNVHPLKSLYQQGLLVEQGESRYFSNPSGHQPKLQDLFSRKKKDAKTTSSAQASTGNNRDAVSATVSAPVSIESDATSDDDVIVDSENKASSNESCKDTDEAVKHQEVVKDPIGGKKRARKTLKTHSLKDEQKGNDVLNLQNKSEDREEGDKLTRKSKRNPSKFCYQHKKKGIEKDGEESTKDQNSIAMQKEETKSEREVLVETIAKKSTYNSTTTRKTVHGNIVSISSQKTEKPTETVHLEGVQLESKKPKKLKKKGRVPLALMNMSLSSEDELMDTLSSRKNTSKPPMQSSSPNQITSTVSVPRKRKRKSDSKCSLLEEKRSKKNPLGSIDDDLTSDSSTKVTGKHPNNRIGIKHRKVRKTPTVTETMDTSTKDRKRIDTPQLSKDVMLEETANSVNDSAANDSAANDSAANDSAANDSAANDSAANDSDAKSTVSSLVERAVLSSSDDKEGEEDLPSYASFTKLTETEKEKLQETSQHKPDKKNGELNLPFRSFSKPIEKKEKEKDPQVIINPVSTDDETEGEKDLPRLASLTKPTEVETNARIQVSNPNGSSKSDPSCIFDQNSDDLPHTKHLVKPLSKSDDQPSSKRKLSPRPSPSNKKLKQSNEDEIPKKKKRQSTLMELIALNSQREAERSSKKARKASDAQAASSGDVIVIDEEEEDDEDKEENLWDEDFENWFHESCIQQELDREQEEAEEKEMSRQIQQTSCPKDLSLDQLHFLLARNQRNLKNIFRGRQTCTRHEDYKRGGKNRVNLTYQIPLGEFTDEQTDFVVESLIKIFCEKHHKYLDYVLKVMFPESLVYISTIVKGESYEEKLREGL